MSQLASRVSACGIAAPGILAALALALAACKSGPPRSIEQVITARIGEIEAAARAHELGDIRDMVSESYADDENNTKQEVRQILTYYFLRNKAIHPFVKVQSVTSEQSGYATAELVVALAGTPVADADELANVRADLYHFVLKFALEDDEWMVRSANWRRAELGDFL